MKKENKNKKSSFRLTEQISAMLEDASEAMHKSKSEIIALAIFTFWQDRKNFVICPGCKKRRWLREEMPFLPGELTEFECECGAKFWWDDEEGKVVKVKKG